MALPLILLPLLGAASGALTYQLRRSRNPYAEVQFPEFDYGGAQNAALSRLGAQSTAAAQAAGRSLASAGLADTSRMASVGRGLSADAMTAFLQHKADLEAMRRKHALELYQHELQKRIYQANMPDIWDYIAAGTRLGLSAAPAMFPGQFTPQYTFPQIPAGG